MSSSRLNAAVTALKRAVGPMIANHATGAVVARIFRDRIPHRGLTIDTGDPVVGNDIKAALFVRGYESSEYRFVRKYVPRHYDVIELGGSLGVVSCTIRRHLERDRKLVIVEADPRLARLLKRNLELNACDFNVTVENKAISYSGATEVAFSLGESSVSGRIAEFGPGLDQVSVPAISLSRLVQEQGFNDFCLVSDIEGVEWHIVRHDLAALAKAKVIVMELHETREHGSVAQLISEILATKLFRLVDSHGSVCVFVRDDGGAAGAA